MDDNIMFPYATITQSAGNKKWVSATAVADYGNAQALWTRPGYPTLNAAEVGSCRLINRSGSTCIVGVGGRYDTSVWRAGQVTAAGVYTDDTPAAQDATTDDFHLYQSGLPDGNGFLLAAGTRFNMVGFILSTAGNQTTPVLLIAYWNGVAWIDLTAAIIYSDALGTPTGEKVLLYNYPNDWALGGSGANVPQTTYNLRGTFTTVAQGSIDPLARQLFVGHGLMVADPVAHLGQGVVDHPASTRFPKQCAALAPFFSNISLANYVEAQIRTWG